jgi:hypothetical protein
MYTYAISKVAVISPLKDGSFACHHSSAHKTTILTCMGDTKNFDLITNSRTTKRSFAKDNLVGILPCDQDGKIATLFRYDPSLDYNIKNEDNDNDKRNQAVPSVKWEPTQYLDMIKLGGDKSFGSLRICLDTFFLQKDFPEIPSKEVTQIQCSSCNEFHADLDKTPPIKNKFCYHNWETHTYKSKFNNGHFDFVTLYCGKPGDIDNLATYIKKHPPEKVLLLQNHNDSTQGNMFLFGKFFGDNPITMFINNPRQAIFSPNGEKIAITHKEGLSILCSMTGEVQQTFELKGLRAVCWSYEGLTIAVASQNEVIIFDME